jgi:hypothetical protein
VLDVKANTSAQALAVQQADRDADAADTTLARAQARIQAAREQAVQQQEAAPQASAECDLSVPADV